MRLIVLKNNKTTSNFQDCCLPSAQLPEVQVAVVSLFAGSSEDGLPGSGGQTGHGLCPSDHGGGGGGTVEGAGREAHQGLALADGRLRGAAPR